VNTVEHALAALRGLSIDNVLIEIDGSEVPILDGSAQGFVEVLEAAGIVEQETDREYLVIKEPVTFFDEESDTELFALPSEHFEVTTLIDFDSPTIGKQYASLDRIEDFKSEIANSRTFVFVREIEHLLDQGLIKGGDFTNAIVIVDRIMDQKELDDLAKKLGKESIKVEKTGVLNTVKLHYDNEPARHKLLDVVGDLALLGRPIKGKIVARKPGHKVNVEFTRKLKKELLRQRKFKGRPDYDPNQKPHFNTQEIEKILPHRHPFLLVDKIVELKEDYVVGIKNVTYDEYFFPGHFPDNPIMPGVLQIEALAQTGGILALAQVDDPENWSTYFIKIDYAKFRHHVVPGDTLILKMELLSPIRRGICEMKGTAYVGDKLAAEGVLIAQIIKEK
ncbi:MAG: bifunctional UDP-3-O-[3-hydroxymyristoyl] N-acetylglucosamine deacetylase/3-hydroxyacyl-ACP dehydratase, partial [Bacteroidia bacterium]|nr:bifunctional UDP-3-O-[3-hydroxymyristoyl] N-acetylglucosamine deacetylase/3-hydroxyacyl-ACP dehydratase [Bacteroidia bacterium]